MIEIDSRRAAGGIWGDDAPSPHSGRSHRMFYPFKSIDGHVNVESVADIDSTLLNKNCVKGLVTIGKPTPCKPLFLVL